MESDALRYAFTNERQVALGVDKYEQNPFGLLLALERREEGFSLRRRAGGIFERVSSFV
jgi:hypothetical protein